MALLTNHHYAAIAYINNMDAQAAAASPLLSSYTENPNSDTPMVPAPKELVGMWKGGNCGLNDPEPVVAELEMADNGANIWSFTDTQTGELMPQTGDGIEVIVGWQCIDVGKGYWWGQVPYSDVLWCNLFQVQPLEPEDNSNGSMTKVSYVNLAYGGQGVGALAEGACPTDLGSLESSMKPLQASFVREIDITDLSMTCNVPAGSDQVQPSYNSQFPADIPIPNPFRVVPQKTVKTLRNANTVTKILLPIMSETTCRTDIFGEAPSTSTNSLDELPTTNSNFLNEMPETSDAYAVIDTFAKIAAWLSFLTITLM